MNKVLLVFSSLLFVLALTSCAYNKEELPSPDEVTVDTNAPIVTYTSHVKAIIDNNCINCHSSVGGQTPFLINYSQVQSQANSGRILTRVINGSPSFMPLSGSLSQPELDTLQMWLNQSSPE